METPAALSMPVDTSANATAAATTAATVATAAAVVTGSEPIVPTVKTPLERLTEAVDTNPLDFNSWVSLLTLVQSEVRSAECVYLYE